MPANTSAPNIVFVHVDQMRHDAISAFGNAHVETPNIDRLIAAGTSFSRSYSANPVCCPARACWYTGRVSSEHGVVENKFPLLESVPDLGQWMGARGYGCYYTGKWHIPNRRVDRSFTLLPGGSGHGEQGDAGVASVACGFLHNYADERPFFLNVGFLNPHDCCFLDFAPRNPATKFGASDVLHAELPPAPGSFDKSNGRGKWDETGVRLYNYYYYRMVEMVDAEVGRVFDALRNSRHARNTLFIFTSDHGDMGGHHNRFKKGQFYDAALRVPLVYVLPGQIRQGNRDEESLVSGVDIPATILDYAGLERMPRMTIAKSLRPLLEGTPGEWRDYVVAESFSESDLRRVVCMKDFKVFFNPAGAVQLYNVKDDPLEMTDLAGSAQHAGQLEQARAFHNEYVDRIELHPKYQSFAKV